MAGNNILSTTMNPSTCYRLIRPIVSSSFVQGAFDGGLNGMLKRYHHISPPQWRIQRGFRGFPRTPSIWKKMKLLVVKVENLVKIYEKNTLEINSGFASSTAPPNNIQDDEDERHKPFSLINPHLIPSTDFRWKSFSSDREILDEGILILKNYLTPMAQVDIVDMCEKWGAGPGGFYQPSDESGVQLPLHMMCFGRNWDPLTKYNNRYRSHDASEPPPIPEELISISQLAVEEAGRYLGEKFPSMSPDVCVVKFCSPSGTLGVHKECDESPDSLKRGLPVVSIFIGDSAEYLYGRTRGKKGLHKVLLESGDVLVFGGASRRIYHGFKEIVVASCPYLLMQATRLDSGCLNLTLKQV